MKKSFTLVELAVVASIIVLFSTIAFVGLRKTRESDGLRSDYQDFYENLKALKIRANLGKIDASLPLGSQTSRQLITFSTGQTFYRVNNVVTNLRNGSRFNWVRTGGNNTNYTGSFTLGLFPQRYSGIMPVDLIGVPAAYNHYIACTGCGAFNTNVVLNDVRIYLTKDGVHGYYIQFSGPDYRIDTITAGGYY